MFNIGDIEIALINDGCTWVDPGGPFGTVPKVLWSEFYTLNPEGFAPMDHHCLLVRAGGKIIVVDTGHGTKLTQKQIEQHLRLERPEGSLVEGLAQRGVSPDDVDLVINTHLHGDHCGGNTRYEDDQVVPTFPNAEYWVQRLEYADAAFPNERTRVTYRAANFDTLYRSGQMRLLDGDIEVIPGMRCVVTPGHTRAHQSIVFEQGGQAALYAADMATYAVHFARLAWLTAYDVEPLVNLETKRNWQHWALERDAILIFEHEPLIPLGRLVPGEKPNIVPAFAD
jgi:glyoxylase-like metal-dependent hydrolase (beta-lactamase superfamily II)